MGPIWGRQDPGGSYVGPMNIVIWGASDIYQLGIDTTLLRQIDV